MDEKDVRITADNLTYSAYQSTMDLLIENNSDQDLSVISGSIGFRVKTSDYQDYLTTVPVFFELGLHGAESGRTRSHGDQHRSNGGRLGTGSL